VSGVARGVFGREGWARWGRFWGSGDRGGGASGRLGWSGARAGGSGGLRCERLEALERVDELAGPWPGALEVELRAASGEREPPGDVDDAVAQALGFGFRELTVEAECLGPDD
jgi:hypothetical protein